MSKGNTAGPNRTQPNPPGNPKGKGPTKRGTRGPRTPRGDGLPHGRHGLTAEKYNEMLAAFSEHQSASYVAKISGVSERTAMRYIDQGDPARGLVPIRQRYIEAQHKAQAIQDRTLAKAMGKSIKIAGYMKSVLEAGLAKVAGCDLVGKIVKVRNPQTGVEEEKALIDPAALKTATDVLNMLTRLESFSFGGADSRVETRDDSVKIIASWTVEEQDAFIRSGRRPAAERLLPGLRRTEEKG